LGIDRNASAADTDTRFMEIAKGLRVGSFSNLPIIYS
jgi:hypothetical protein